MALKPRKNTTDDPPWQSWPFFWMTQAVGRYIRQLERALKQVDLDVSRWRVLMAAGNGKASVSQIAELAIVKLPTMMKIVQRMQADGMLICESRPSDGRFTDVFLTPKGRDARQRAWEIANGIYDRAFSDTSSKDQQFLNKLLQEIFERLGD